MGLHSFCRLVVFTEDENEFIFQNKELNWKEVVELIKLRVALWVRTKWDPPDYSMNDFIYRLGSIWNAS